MIKHFSKALLVMIIGVLSFGHGALIIGVTVFADSSCTQPYSNSVYDFSFNNQVAQCSQAPLPGSPSTAVGITAIEATCSQNANHNLTSFYITYFNTSAPPAANYTPSGPATVCPLSYPSTQLLGRVYSGGLSTPCSNATLAGSVNVYIQGICTSTNSAMARVPGTLVWGVSLMAGGLLLLVL